MTYERARQLLREQRPELLDRATIPVEDAGTDNLIFQLEDLALRLPLTDAAEAQLFKEQQLWPRLAPLPIEGAPVIELGAPCAAWPRHWALTIWIDGEPAWKQPISGDCGSAETLGETLVQLRARPTDGAPLSGPENHFRGAPLRQRDALVRESLARLRGELDVGTLARVWERGLRAEPWDEPPRWLHGDLHGGNLIVRSGQLAGLIDLGLAAVGDPAVDLMAGWWVFSGEAREAFREAARLDAQSWERGRGWALSVALIALAHDISQDIPLTRMCWQTLAELTREAEA